MKKKGDIVKELVKNPAPKSTFGTDPNDPWSSKTNIAENITSQRAGTLAQFLKAKGYNPKFITKDRKDSFAKTGEFLKWKRDHGIYEENDLDEEEKFSMKISPEMVRSNTHDSPTRKREDQLHHAALAGKVKTRNPKIRSMTGTPMSPTQSFSKIDMTEDNFADPKAATQAPFDAASCPNDLAPENARRKKVSSIVKEMYKKLKEDLYDFEKDQKDGTKKSINARYVLKGGTTMTGEPRNEVSIDPEMADRSKVTDYTNLNTNNKNNK